MLPQQTEIRTASRLTVAIIMEPQHVLVVEDEADIQELLCYNLKKEGYLVDAVSSGEVALKSARARPPHLMLLDLMLPGMDGLEVCRLLKKDPATEAIPILMVTAKGEEADIVAGLELGADDYVTKPFSPRVLIARVRMVLRREARTPPDGDSMIHVHELTRHPGRREVRAKGEAVELTFTEFHILHLLARRPGWVYTRNQIVEGVRGGDYPVTERAVDVQIVALRKKLGNLGALIETVRGVGYRIRD